MNQSQTLGMQFGRGLHLHGAQAVRTGKKTGHGHAGNPFVIRRAYDICTSCGRQDTDSGDAPLVMHIRGEKTTPLVRVVGIGAAVLGAAAAAALICRIREEWKIRRKYAKQYAHRLQKQQLRMQLRKQKAGGQNDRA